MSWTAHEIPGFASVQRAESMANAGPGRLLRVLPPRVQDAIALADPNARLVDAHPEIDVEGPCLRLAVTSHAEKRVPPVQTGLVQRGDLDESRPLHLLGRSQAVLPAEVALHPLGPVSDLAREADDAVPVRVVAQHRGEPLHPIRSAAVVGFHVADPLHARAGERQVEGRGRAPMVGVAENDHPGVLAGDCVQHLHGRVRRAVIDDDHLQLGVFLREQVLQRSADVARRVAHGHQHGDRTAHRSQNRRAGSIGPARPTNTMPERTADPAGGGAGPPGMER